MISLRNLFMALIVLSSGFIGNPLQAANRSTSYPYLSGDTFRAYCNFIFDETQSTFKPSKVKKGNTVFVKTDRLKEFFKKIHPKIQHPYILITHNSDHHVPGPFVTYLDDPKIIAWFGQNIEYSHYPKMHHIPIGLANRCWPHGNVKFLKEVKDSQADATVPLYLNFSIGTYPTERSFVHDLFCNQPYCMKSSPKDFKAYLMDLKRSRFTLSPRGNGLDCHRTWEALYMGSIPVVKASSLDALYEGLPVLIVQDWNQINEEFLEQKWIEFSGKDFQYERLYADYWFNLIDTYK
jgi:hypothetical protein